MSATLNYAAKYASVVDERFRLGTLTGGIVNNNFDWIGVSTVKVFSRDLATLGNYDMTTGSNRYGTPDDLGNAVQEMTFLRTRHLPTSSTERPQKIPLARWKPLLLWQRTSTTL